MARGNTQAPAQKAAVSMVPKVQDQPKTEGEQVETARTSGFNVEPVAAPPTRRRKKNPVTGIVTDLADKYRAHKADEDNVPDPGWLKVTASTEKEAKTQQRQVYEAGQDMKPSGLKTRTRWDDKDVRIFYFRVVAAT